MGLKKLALSCFMLLLVLLARTGLATEVQGRVLFGGYFAKENFAASEATGGSTRNDFATGSGRLYLNATKISDREFQFTLDMRDRHDFFDKLDRERATLTALNTPQARTVVARYPNEDGRLYFSLGRFGVPQAGAVFTDGAEIGLHWSNALSSGIFGGRNPKQDDRSDLEFNPAASVFGAYLEYAPKRQLPGNAVFWTQAISAKQNSGHLDRLYLFENFSLTKPSDLFTGVAYFDFVPRFSVQNLNLMYQRRFFEQFQASIGGAAIDVIEYSRRRGVLERLSPSAYQEAAVRTEYEFASIVSLELALSHGRRQSDGLFRQEAALKGTFSSESYRALGGHLRFGYRNNFTSQDLFVGLGAEYYSDVWELGLTEDFQIQKYHDTEVLHPLISEINVARYLSQTLFTSASAQYAFNERVGIFSGFLKVGYRFGTQKGAPSRDATYRLERL